MFSSLFRVTVRCVYPLSDLYKLFAYWRFDADSPGVGTILTRVPVKSKCSIVVQLKRVVKLLQLFTPDSLSNQSISAHLSTHYLNHHQKTIDVHNYFQHRPESWEGNAWHPP